MSGLITPNPRIDYSRADFIVYRYWEDRARLLYQGPIPDCVRFIMKSPKELILRDENFKRIGFINDSTPYQQEGVIDRASITQIYPAPISELERLLVLAQSAKKTSSTSSGIIIPKGISL